MTGVIEAMQSQVEFNMASELLKQSFRRREGNDLVTPSMQNLDS